MFSKFPLNMKSYKFYELFSHKRIVMLLLAISFLFLIFVFICPFPGTVLGSPKALNACMLESIKSI